MFRSGKASELSAKADLITAYTYAYKKGQPFISCVDFDTGEPVDIPLPPGILPNQLADKLFAKARKLRRSVIALRALLNEVDVQLNYLRELEASLLTLQEYRRCT